MKILLKILSLIVILSLLSSCVEEPEDSGDTSAPIITGTDPSNGATEVSVATNITVTFSEEINISSVSSASFEITANGDPASIGGTVSVSDNEVVFNPSTNLEFDTEYVITVTAGIEDLAGNESSQGSLSFTTEAGPDEESPSVVSINPENETTDVSLSANIEVTFSEPIDLGSVSDNTIALTTPAFSNNIEAEVSIDGNVMTINPTVDFEEGAEYTLNLTTGLTDLAGNGLNAAFESTFTTESFDTESPSVVSWSVFNGEEGIAVDASITVTFSEPMATSSLDGNILFRKLGTTEYLDISFSTSGNDVIVTPDETMKGNVEYVIDVTTGVTDLAGNLLDFAKGRVFKTEGVALTIVSMTPEDDATNVEIDQDIIITFSEPIDESTVSVFWSGSGSSFNTSVDGNVLTVSPATTWTEFERSYILQINSTIEDVYGNSLATSEFLSFETIFVSENYYYTIENYEADQYLAFQSATPQVTYSSTVNDESKWRFIESGGEFAIRNKFLEDNNWSSQFLYTFPLHIDDELGYLDVISTGSLWSFTTPTNGVRAMYSRGNLLDGQAITMTSDQSTSSGYRWWYFVRDSKIN